MSKYAIRVIVLVTVLNIAALANSVISIMEVRQLRADVGKLTARVDRIVTTTEDDEQVPMIKCIPKGD